MPFSDIFDKPGISDSNLIYTKNIQDKNPYLSMIAFGKLVIEADNSIKVNEYNCLCVAFSLTGTVYITSGDTQYILPKSGLALIDCKTKHSISSPVCAAELMVVYLEGEAAPYFFNIFSENSGAAAAVTNYTKSDFSRHFTQMYENSRAYTEDTLLQFCFLTNLLVGTIKQKTSGHPPKKPPQEYLINIKQLFDEEYVRSYTLDMLEHRFHVNKYKIVKDFTKHYGMSPISYLNKRRIDAAKLLLERTNNRINEVGYAVGFETTNHFIHLFKKHTSMTPAVYRKLQRGY